ncbi:MAG: tRNA dihydrouridine synthase DusB [bacterium]|jgi:nifR3 family TIM-barrel protein|nr:tRNA dihydrouridine synthase DusB [bacterium]
MASTPAKSVRTLRIGELKLADALLLAPMEGYSDQPFRRICRRLGADLAYTEFTSSEALVRLAGRSASKISLADDERPVGIQIYGRDPGRMAQAARQAAANRPELVDINFGCPARKVCGGGAGSQLMREPDLLLQIAGAVVQAVDLPVTVKMRLGWDGPSRNAVELALRLQDLGVKAVTIHGRTRCQKFEGQADWDGIAEVKRALEIPVIGNGDVRSPEDARRLFDHTGVDAVMIGRAAIHYPWIFRETRAFLDRGQNLPPPGLEEKVDLLLEHLDLAVQHKGEQRAVLEMRKMYVAYLRDHPGIKALRAELMTLVEAAAVRGRLLELRADLEPGAEDPRELESLTAAP